jgi:hypothetical protein
MLPPTHSRRRRTSRACHRTLPCTSPCCLAPLALPRPLIKGELVEFSRAHTHKQPSLRICCPPKLHGELPFPNHLLAVEGNHSRAKTPPHLPGPSARLSRHPFRRRRNSCGRTTTTPPWTTASTSSVPSKARNGTLGDPTSPLASLPAKPGLSFAGFQPSPPLAASRDCIAI